MGENQERDGKEEVTSFDGGNVRTPCDEAKTWTSHLQIVDLTKPVIQDNRLMSTSAISYHLPSNSIGHSDPFHIRAT